MSAERGEQILSELVGLFGGRPASPPVKRLRAKPHRCLDCRKVTKHVRCHACTGTTRCLVCKWEAQS